MMKHAHEHDERICNPTAQALYFGSFALLGALVHYACVVPLVALVGVLRWRCGALPTWQLRKLLWDLVKLRTSYDGTDGYVWIMVFVAVLGPGLVPLALLAMSAYYPVALIGAPCLIVLRCAGWRLGCRSTRVGWADVRAMAAAAAMPLPTKDGDGELIEWHGFPVGFVGLIWYAVALLPALALALAAVSSFVALEVAYMLVIVPLCFPPAWVAVTCRRYGVRGLCRVADARAAASKVWGWLGTPLALPRLLDDIWQPVRRVLQAGVSALLLLPLVCLGALWHCLCRPLLVCSASADRRDDQRRFRSGRIIIGEQPRADPWLGGERASTQHV